MNSQDQNGWTCSKLILVLALLAVLAGVGILLGQGLSITRVSIDPQRRITLHHPADTNAYYILFRGETVTDISRPIDVALGEHRDPQTAEGLLKDLLPLSNQAFYRIRRVPLDQPLDLDGDGIDDVYELRH